jgi:glutamate racemase
MIGVFDSGYGGLNILSSLLHKLPAYDFIYLGDNARAPYGARSFEVIYEFTKQGVKWLFDNGCTVVVVACNTASARALRTLQQKWLPVWYSDRRLLGSSVGPHMRQILYRALGLINSDFDFANSRIIQGWRLVSPRQKA